MEIIIQHRKDAGLAEKTKYNLTILSNGEEQETLQYFIRDYQTCLDRLDWDQGGQEIDTL